MNSYKNYIPDGTKDILFNECSSKKNIQHLIRNTFIERGYKEVISPTLEYYDVFDFKNQPIPQEKMYKFFDNKGRILVLRPDMTMPIARICSSKISNFPIKLCYSENVFRMNESLHGKMNEITQSGVEIIGASDVKADAELIITAIESLINVGINNFKIEIGNINFYKSIIEDIGMDEIETEKLRKLVENKNFASVRNFINERKNIIDENSIEILKKLPELFGNISTINEAEKLINDKNALCALNNIREVYSLIDNMGYSEFISIDLGMIQHINYYTGFIFRGYVNELGEEILSGGRYDNSLEEFGNGNYATGFALNIDNILKTLKNKNEPQEELKPQYIIYYQTNLIKKAYEIYNKLKKKIRVEMALINNENDAIKYCYDNNIDKLISLTTKHKIIFDIPNNTNKAFNWSEFNEKY
ncbi:ATP phosphoribosyltransferase regulatory subunit [Clostridium aestuarii]|uniref:ATP phosphoribosyltransferase regulatory subunit n=1 Tax=Clostridium aestuarii TaxID=338193 RepID=A0ABT4CV72_9CLOT|nr:ATP phosphoribosyltransferase regulatory subunit [Clostridium aestuarii]MCY6482878.1 ATP phosphoribosyltransferase regulatory subunit [Clostridium aestuarii]